MQRSAPYGTVTQQLDRMAAIARRLIQSGKGLHGLALLDAISRLRISNAKVGAG